MQPFTVLESVAVPMLRPNVDTDAIIPSREIKAVAKTGLADGLFAGWRYLTPGGRDPDPDFVLNDPAYTGAQILLGGSNFGCGSSREHAVWALGEYGFRAVIAPSFSPIFRGNCVRNGIAPIVLPEAAVAELEAHVRAEPKTHPVRIDLVERQVSVGELRFGFEIDDEAREMLLEGADAIDMTLKHSTAIQAFREADRKRRPWAYLGQDA